ncbi:hypothetical protein ABE527_19175 [Brucella sp. TWI432]
MKNILKKYTLILQKFFQFTLVALIASSLTGCNSVGSSGAPANASQKEELQDYAGLKAFKAICLDTAPSFSNAVAVARRFGVQDFIELGEGKAGMSADNSLSAQIKPNHECAVTTAKYSGNRLALRKAFIATVSSVTGKGMSGSKVPFTAEIQGVPLIFMHDPNGGEAFVILRAK